MSTPVEPPCQPSGQCLRASHQRQSAFAPVVRAVPTCQPKQSLKQTFNQNLKLFISYSFHAFAFVRILSSCWGLCSSPSAPRCRRRRRRWCSVAEGGAPVCAQINCCCSTAATQGAELAWQSQLKLVLFTFSISSQAVADACERSPSRALIALLQQAATAGAQHTRRRCCSEHPPSRRRRRRRRRRSRRRSRRCQRALPVRALIICCRHAAQQWASTIRCRCCYVQRIAAAVVALVAVAVDANARCPRSSIYI